MKKRTEQWTLGLKYNLLRPQFSKLFGKWLDQPHELDTSGKRKPVVEKMALVQMQES